MKQKVLGQETPIIGLAGRTLGDFWAWAYSDVLSNRNRSVLAEYIVGALLAVVDEPRVEWDAVDLRYRGKGIEVKSAAYLQSWQQTGPSKITFDIGKKKSWDAATNTYSPEAVRTADIYVFCLFAETDPEKANVLDLRQWKFWVVPTATIDCELRSQKSLSLSRLESLAKNLDFDDVGPTIDEWV
jgi:hypothetical protein